MKWPWAKKKSFTEEYAEFLTDVNYLYSVENWVPLFEEGAAHIFDVQIVPIDNIRITMDADKYIKAYGQNGELILTAKDYSRQVVIDYSLGKATIFTGGVVYIIGKEGEQKAANNEYR